jgi:hypothetical protein
LAILFRFLLFIVFPIAAFVGGYQLTDLVFREKVIPYPFEIYGVAMGLGFFFWMLALASIFNDQWNQ